MRPKYFKTHSDFRKWLAANHERETELLVGFYKVGSGRPSMTWPQSVDEALCFGWIDGVRRRIDDESYSIRFTPRKPSSIWSAVNIAKVEELIKAGLMQEPGMIAFEKRRADKSGIYAYENAPVELSPEFEKLLRDNRAAWRYFDSQAPSYKRTVVHWIMRAKRQETREMRLQRLIESSEDGRRLA